MLLIKTLLSSSSHQVHGVMCLYLATNAWTLITNTCSSIYLLRLLTSTYICNKVILYQCKMLLLWELLPLYNWLSSLLIFISLEHNTNLDSIGTLKACMLTMMVSLLTYMVTLTSTSSQEWLRWRTHKTCKLQSQWTQLPQTTKARWAPTAVRSMQMTS